MAVRLTLRKGRRRSAGLSHRLRWDAEGLSWMSGLKMKCGCSVVMGERCCGEDWGGCSEACVHCAPDRCGTSDWM